MPLRTSGQKAHLRALLAVRNESAPYPGPAGTRWAARGRRPHARPRGELRTARQAGWTQEGGSQRHARHPLEDPGLGCHTPAPSPAALGPCTRVLRSVTRAERGHGPFVPPSGSPAVSAGFSRAELGAGQGKGASAAGSGGLAEEGGRAGAGSPREWEGVRTARPRQAAGPRAAGWVCARGDCATKACASLSPPPPSFLPPAARSSAPLPGPSPPLPRPRPGGWSRQSGRGRGGGGRPNMQMSS